MQLDMMPTVPRLALTNRGAMVPWVRLVRERGRGAYAAAPIPCRSPKEVYGGVRAAFAELEVESFQVLLLDSQHCAIGRVEVTRGILDSSLVHPREVFRTAIAGNAKAIICLHNHPSGDPTPSADDRAITQQLVAAGRLLDIPVHDHIIVGRTTYFSFAESGTLF